jgi:hypothetical protein
MARSRRLVLGGSGGLPLFDPPVMYRKPVSCFTRSGFMIVSQCCHSVRSTSAELRHVCDVMLST